MNTHLAGIVSSKYKGVSWSKQKQKWSVYIKTDVRQLNLGCFDDEVEAAKAYDEAASKYHGEFANLNLPQSNVKELDVG